jgi:hypothetical protein
MLMIGVTLSLGSFVAFSALTQFGLVVNSASLGAGLDQSSAETQLGLVYAAVSSSNSCPVSGGVHEGVSLSLALYNYGSSSFSPSELLVNATAYPGTYGAIAPNSLGIFTVALAGCAHSSGQSVMIADSSGDEFQVAS